MHTHHRIQRTAGSAVSFIGTLVAQASSPSGSHAVSVYRTRAGKSWIVHIDYAGNTATWPVYAPWTAVVIVRAIDEQAASKIAEVLKAYPVQVYL